jgi:hypothetical protein
MIEELEKEKSKTGLVADQEHGGDRKMYSSTIGRRKLTMR